MALGLKRLVIDLAAKCFTMTSLFGRSFCYIISDDKIMMLAHAGFAVGSADGKVSLKYFGESNTKNVGSV